MQRIERPYYDSPDAVWSGDGKRFTAEDGLGSYDELGNCRVASVLETRDGTIWAGTHGNPGCLCRFDGQRFEAIPTPHPMVVELFEDSCGRIWMGGFRGGGLSCYDGKTLITYTTVDELPSDAVMSLLEDDAGNLWVGTLQGLCCFDGKQFICYGKEHGLSNLTHECSAEDEHGQLWFGMLSGGIYRYDGVHFQQLTTDDGLPHNSVAGLVPQPDGSMLIGTYDGIVHYRPTATVPPRIEIRDVKLVTMQTEIEHLRREVGQKYHFSNIIGRSAALKHVRALMEKAIDSGLTVLITGETGTGKELVAKGIHTNSPRKNKPMSELNCGSMPKDLVAGHLFGHRKGAFTGATRDQIGLFRSAEGGTVILDEIGEMPLEAQPNLLRVLQERKVQPLGEYVSHDVDVRVIAVTNRDLAEEVEAERFREDLYHRLNEFPIHVPPLRERPEDIPC